MRLPHDYFIFDVSLIEFKNFSPNAVIKGKSLAIEMPNISTGPVSKYHYSGDVALKRNFNKPEKESII